MVQPKEIAITVDDLPIHGDTTLEYSRIKIVENFINTFKKFNLPPVMGFANMSFISPTCAGSDIIQKWINAGNQLANHTFSHLDLENVSADEFIHDINKNENKLINWPNFERYFRYPFLSESKDFKKRNIVFHYLMSHNYRIAPVTIDFYDFLWNTALSKCLAHNNYQGIEDLKAKYISSAVSNIHQAFEISKKLFFYPIKHILLLHLGLATSLFMEPLIQTLKLKNYRFITLKEALRDPIYQLDFYKPHRNGFNFIQQAADAYQMDVSNYPNVPRKNVMRYAYNLPTNIVL